MKQSEGQRRAVLDWMNTVIGEEQLSAEQWAKKAGISPTTITEFLSGNRCFLPSTATLTRMAESVGYEIKIEKKDFSEVSINYPGLTELDLIKSKQTAQGYEMDVAEKVKIPIPNKHKPAEMVLVQVDSTLQSNAGILPGDRLIVDKTAALVPGDTIAIYCVNNGMMAGLYFPPNIVWADGSENLPINKLQGEILGKAIEVFRTL